MGAKRTILTDLSYCLENTVSNVKANGEIIEVMGQSPNTIKVAELDWFDPQKSCETDPQKYRSIENTDPQKYPFPADVEKIDTIIGADIIWVKELVRPLCETIDFLFEKYKATTFILANQQRSAATEADFFRILTEEKKFKIQRRDVIMDRSRGDLINLSVYIIVKDTDT